MARASDRWSARRDAWLVAACLAASVAALFLSPARGQSVAAALRQTVLAPLVWLQSDASQGRQTRGRFNLVVAERDSAVLSAQQVTGLKAENADLRALLGLGRKVQRGFHAVEVLHQPQPTDGRTVLLGGGKRDGIEEFSPVVGAGGLIGVVRAVSPETSIAMTWAHPDWRASAVTIDGGAYGLVAPSAAGSASETALEFRAVTYHDTVPNGTLVVTSGLGGVYPKGIPVGVVDGVSREQTGWERVYRLRPAANPSAAVHVLVLDSARVGDLTAAFPRTTAVSAAARDSSRVAAGLATPGTPPVVAAPPAGARRDSVGTRRDSSVVRRDSAVARPRVRLPGDTLRPVRDSLRARRDTTRPKVRTGEPAPVPPDSL